MLRNVLVFPWYRPLYQLPVIIAAFCLYLRNTRILFILLVWIPTSLLLIIIEFNLAQQVYAAISNPSYFTGFMDGARVRLYQSTGKQLYASCPQARLLASEIGGLGDTFDGYVLDGVGLVSPEALKYHPLAVPSERSNGDLGAIPVGFIRLQKPDLIVSYDCFIEAFLKSSEYALLLEIAKSINPGYSDYC